MYRDELTATSVINLDADKELRLDYYIRTFDIDNEPGYGLRVDMRGESKATMAFTRDYDGLVNMARAFAEGSVMPCTLAEMCDEWESTYLKDTEHFGSPLVDRNAAQLQFAIT